MDYRVYLLDAASHQCATENFVAADAAARRCRYNGATRRATVRTVMQEAARCICVSHHAFHVTG